MTHIVRMYSFARIPPYKGVQALEMHKDRVWAAPRAAYRVWEVRKADGRRDASGTPPVERHPLSTYCTLATSSSTSAAARFPSCSSFLCSSHSTSKRCNWLASGRDSGRREEWEGNVEPCAVGGQALA